MREQDFGADPLEAFDTLQNLPGMALSAGTSQRWMRKTGSMLNILRLIPFAGSAGYKGQDRRRAMVQVAKEGFGGYIVMDAVDDILAGDLISVTLRNVGPESVIVKSVAVRRGAEEFSAALSDISNPVKLFPSIHRPITIQLKRTTARSTSLDFSLVFELVAVGTGTYSTETLETELISIKQRKWGEAYMYTFMDFDGSVHYAAAIPPKDPSSQPADSAPVLVSLHGAGVEVSQSPFWLSEYQQRKRTWIVLPTGRSPWGYDWHGASAKNVLNAIQSLADNLPGVPKELKGISGIKPDPERLFMAGHSNGGQGAWYFATHFPDMAIAATPAAGYVNIKQYVPYFGWISNSYTDSFLRGLLESSITEFDNDVHMSNTVGIPILARTGSADDNVPPFNSRKLVRLGQENAHNLSAISLSEIPGAGHWFTGVLHDDIMLKFLKQHLHDDTVPEEGTSRKQDSIASVAHPPFPSVFEISVINPAGMGSKGSIQIEQLSIPFRKGTIKVEILKHRQDHGDYGVSTTWVLHTTNIRRFRFLDSPSMRLRRGAILNLIIDGVSFSVDNRGNEISMGTFVRQNTSKGQAQWQFSSSNKWTLDERHRETYGPAIQILEKRVVVVLGTQFSSQSTALSQAADRIAKLVAHDIYLYGRGDVEAITDDEYLTQLTMEVGDNDRSNLVLIGDHHQNSVTKHILPTANQEVRIDSQEGYVSIDPKADMASSAEFRKPGTGLLMIRPWGPSNLAMMIAGLDARGLETAARLFPKRTGLLMPDWEPNLSFIMKTFKTILVVGVACLQLLSGSQAQSTSAASSSSAATATSTSAAPVVTPSQPFINTEGLVVSSPFNQMTVVQNTVLSISASLRDKRPISSVNISVAKKDGSSNTTIVSIPYGSVPMIAQTWNVSSDKYPIGDYLVNIIITPNTTINSPTSIPLPPPNTSNPPSTTTVTQPIVTPSAVGSGPNVYYFQALVHVAAPRVQVPSAAMGMKFDRINSGSSFAAFLAAVGVTVVGSLLAL
ncbi:hypothetical protein BGX27_010744 [Mortierella sp. AM989]|nr:hypothetical protein BGX27_010744 [Mortierella sp. AM989]